MKFSANLGFLWNDRPLPDAVRAAAKAGFDAVELHWPYDTDARNMRAALDETGLPVLGLNTRRGDLSRGENGLSALPGREAEAREAIDEAFAYAREIGAGAVHVMAGVTDAPAARDVFRSNLDYALARAGDALTVLIEPLNHRDAPGYHLTTTAQAVALIGEIGSPRLRLMFDCYHVQIMEGDLSHRLSDLLPLIGHIQFASVPDRGPPGRGEISYAHIFDHIAALGWDHPLGAEYRVTGATEDSLEWLRAFRERKNR